jgi:hypothetical protein
MKNENENARIGYFFILKFIEISILLILIFGIYYLGVYANNLPYDSCNFRLGLDIKCPHADNPTKVDLWGIGILFLMLIIFTLLGYLVAIIITIFILYYIISINWDWAKKLAMTEEEKRKKYKMLPGDVVKIKNNLKNNKYYGEVKFIKKMKKYEGCVGKILKLDKTDNTYRLSVDNEKYWWTVSMLELMGEKYGNV